MTTTDDPRAAERVLRRLGPAEQIFHYYNEANPCAFTILAHLSAPLDLPTLRAAVRTLQASHPLLSATVLTDDGSSAAERDDTIAPVWVHTSVPVATQVTSTTDVSAVLAGEQTVAFHTGSGPQWRALLVPGVSAETRRDFPDAVCSVALTFDHRIADGIAGSTVLRDLIRVLNGEALPTHAVPEPQEELLPLTTSGAVVELSALDARFTAPGRIRRFDGAAPSVVTRVLSRDDTSAVVTTARRSGVTVQSVLAAAADIALARAGRSYVRIVHPSDLRRLFDLPDNEVALRLTLPPPRTGVAATEATSTAFWPLAVRVHESLRTNRNPDRVAQNSLDLYGAVPHTPAEATEGMLAISSLDVMLTNLGVVDGLAGSEVRCVGILGPCMTVQIEGEIIVGVVTFDGRMSFTAATHADLSGVLDDMIAAALEACA